MKQPIPITRLEVSQAVNFARDIRKKEEDNPTGRNNNRGDHSNRTERETIGKLAEIAASKVFGGRVDFTIYNSNVFGPDLIDCWENPILNEFTGDNLHVKCCKLDKRFEPSWLVEKKDPIVTAPTEKDIIILMRSDINTTDYLGWLYASQFTDWEDPIMESLKGYKKAIYYDKISSDILKPS